MAALGGVLLLPGTAMAQGGGLSWDWESVWLQLEKGGTTMWFLGALSVVALAFALERAIHLRRGRFAPKGLSDRIIAHWRRGEFDQVKAEADKSRSTLGRSVKKLVEFRSAPLAELQSIAGDTAALDLRPQFRRLQPLAVVAALAPLLGLFGTVIGMISAFEDFRLLGETGDPTVFAGSISKALVTTATGLVIAMPSLAAYHYFKNRTDAYSDVLEEELHEITLAAHDVTTGGRGAAPAAG